MHHVQFVRTIRPKMEDVVSHQEIVHKSSREQPREIPSISLNIVMFNEKVGMARKGKRNLPSPVLLIHWFELGNHQTLGRSYVRLSREPHVHWLRGRSVLTVCLDDSEGRPSDREVSVHRYPLQRALFTAFQTHCAHSQHFNGSRSAVKIFLSSHPFADLPYRGATETTSTTWTSCDLSLSHFFAC